MRRLLPGVLSGAPAALAARNAARVTLAACAGFYPCLYVLHQPVTATYALFAVVSMGTPSRIPGTGRQQAPVIARALPVGWALVTAGTLLAVNTWAAVAGTLLVSFVLAFAAAAGPRPAGAAPGLHLLYILPCFPPFAPQTLGQRLVGVTVGVALLVAADTLLFRDPAPPGYRALLADATAAAAGCAEELAGGRGLRPVTRERAHRAGEALSPGAVPPAERPAAPGRHERALSYAGGAVRQLLARLSALPPPAAGPGGAAVGRETAVAVRAAERRLLESIGAVVGQAAQALRAEGPVTAVPPASALDGALADFRRERLFGPSPSDRPALRAAMLRQAALVEAGEAARTLLGSIAVAAGEGDRTELPEDLAAGPLWFARVETWELWAVRLTRNVNRRSVFFQNAVRTSLGLAAARAVTGVVAIPHGFWAMLAALTLTRTSTTQTGRTVRRALTGTLLGALAAAGLLVAAGQHHVAYAVVLPVVMLAAFLFGPLLGVGWAQGLFTVVVSMVFAQLAPAGWQLAEVRFLAVLTGSLIGLLCGLLAWPHGVRGELRRDVATVLRIVASTITDTVMVLTGSRREPSLSQARVIHRLTLAEATYAQCQGEPADLRADGIDWQAALIAGHHAVRGSNRLLGSRTAPGQGPGALREHRDDGLCETATRVANEYLALAEQLDPVGGDPARSERLETAPYGFAGIGPRVVTTERLTEGADGFPAQRLLLFDTGVWLQGLALDLGRIRTGPPRGTETA
ncbi:FUSC family protein [Kitasatospora sp. HPMI-4]|uniref:FUSC family protein n=1 Tax=Kitasatospora sp. HPMI-4 TaxID=3448443 RepID=UPI003F1BABD7